MKMNLNAAVFGCVGFCVGFTVCCLLFVPTANQSLAASAAPGIQIVPGRAAVPVFPHVQPAPPDWQPQLILPTLPPQFRAYKK